MINRIRRCPAGPRLPRIALAAAVLLVVDAGHAQQGGEARIRPLEELVVTAQKREERIQDVPVSVAVIAGDALQQFGQNETTDLAYRVPSLGVSNSAGPRSFGFFIRGIGTTSFASESVESSSAFVLDGVVLGQAGASLMDLPDVERVEVLRGPQGTLFGKNASAGVINVVTRAPAEEFEAVARISAAWPDDERKIAGYVSGPISDEVRYLVSARMNKRDGFVENLHDGREFNDRDDYGVRGRLEVTPSDNFTLTAIGDWWRRRADCCVWTLRSAGTPLSDTEQAHLDLGAEFGTENDTQNLDGDVFSDVDSSGFSVQGDYEFGDGYTFTSISAFRRWHTVDGLDSDSLPQDVLNVNFADFEQDQFTQELRVTSPVGPFVDYVAGLFYFHSRVHSESQQLFPTFLPPPPLLNRIVDNYTLTENMAVFGQANVNLTEGLRVILGGRLLREKSEAEKIRLDPVLAFTETNQASKTDDAEVWRVGVQYDVTPDVNVFATVTRGYKGGGYDVGIGTTDLNEVFPEEPTNYEIGLRSAFPDAGVLFNLTAFRLEVDDLQVTAREPGDVDVGLFLLLNAASALSEGVETEVLYQPFDDVDLTINGSLAYVDGIYESFPSAPCYRGQTEAEGCVGGIQDQSGDQLPHSPKWSFNLTSSYSTPVAGDLRLSFDVNYSYRTSTPINTPNDPRTRQESFPLLNLAVGIGPGSERWRITAFGRNLTDESFETRRFNTPLVSGVGAYSSYRPYEARRIYGLTFEVRN